jgi:dTDP-4-amino-4,6-dideoxygalactose transaminase
VTDPAKTPDPAADPVPFLDLSIQHAAVADEVAAGWEAVLARTAFIDGPAVRAFETEFAAACGVEHCVGVANGTDAIELLLRGLGIGRGDEVILPANTFIATAEAVDRAGATPVLVDCDPATALIDEQHALDAVSPATRAIIAVHLYGQIAPTEIISKGIDGDRVVLLEDAAQSQGATRNGRPMGTFGRGASTSFYPGKNLGAYGDGGAVVTDDGDLAALVRKIGAHGSAVRYQHDVMGVNSRLDTLQAVVLSAKLRRLDGWNAERRAAAARYAELLADLDRVTLPTVADGNDAVWHLFVIQVPERDRVVAELHERGVGAAIHYPVPVHLSPAFAHLDRGPGSYPVAEAAAESILSLPMFPGITADQQDRVARALRDALAG